MLGLVAGGWEDEAVLVCVCPAVLPLPMHSKFLALAEQALWFVGRSGRW